jgi:hypothetical protein
MAKSLCVIALAAVLAGCSGVPTYVPRQSACAGGEASYACQVERYHNVAI